MPQHFNRKKQTSVRCMTAVEAAWVGAMIEGEGTVGLYKTSNSRYPHVSVYNNCVETIATVLRLVGSGSVTHDARRRPIISWHWQLQNWVDATALLKQVMPYLTGKRDRAQEVIDASTL